MNYKKKNMPALFANSKLIKKNQKPKTEVELAKIRSVFILETKFKHVMLT